MSPPLPIGGRRGTSFTFCSSRQPPHRVDAQTLSRRWTNKEWMTQRSTTIRMIAQKGWTGMNTKFVSAWTLTMMMPAVSSRSWPTIWDSTVQGGCGARHTTAPHCRHSSPTGTACSQEGGHQDDRVRVRLSDRSPRDGSLRACRPLRHQHGLPEAGRRQHEHEIGTVLRQNAEQSMPSHLVKPGGRGSHLRPRRDNKTTQPATAESWNWRERIPHCHLVDSSVAISRPRLSARATQVRGGKPLAIRSNPKTRNSTAITASLCTASQSLSSSRRPLALAPPTR